MAEEIRYEVNCYSRLMGTESFCSSVLTFIRSASINSLVMSHNFRILARIADLFV